MKLTGLLEVIRTYYMYLSEFSSWWSKIMPIWWPPNYKPMGKYENASRFAQADRNHPMLSGSWPLTHLWWSGCNWRHLMLPEVKWGHNPFFANKSRQDGDRDAQMVPNDLARQAASKDMHVDLLGSWPDLSESKSICFEPVRWGEHDDIIFIFVSL